MKNQYTNLVRLLFGPKKPFREQMYDLDSATIVDILKPKQNHFKQEEYFLLVGQTTSDNTITCQTVGYETQGDPGYVEFSWEYCLRRHQEKGDVIGWLHTHPPGIHRMSKTDINTFYSWIVTIGGPRYSIIICDNKVHCWELNLQKTKLHYLKIECHINVDGVITINPKVAL